MCESNYHPDFLWSPSPCKDCLWFSLCTGLSTEVQPQVPTFSLSQLCWWSFQPSCFWGWISSKLLAFSFPQPPHLFLLLYKVHLESARPSGSPRWHPQGAWISFWHPPGRSQIWHHPSAILFATAWGVNKPIFAAEGKVIVSQSSNLIFHPAKRTKGLTPSERSYFSCLLFLPITHPSFLLWSSDILISLPWIPRFSSKLKSSATNPCLVKWSLVWLFQIPWVCSRLDTYLILLCGLTQ